MVRAAIRQIVLCTPASLRTYLSNIRKLIWFHSTVVEAHAPATEAKSSSIVFSKTHDDCIGLVSLLPPRAQTESKLPNELNKHNKTTVIKRIK